MADSGSHSRRTAGVAVVALAAFLGAIPAVATPSAVPETVWTRQFGTAGEDHPGDVAASGPSSYVVGTTEGKIGSAAFGAKDVVVRKYDPKGAAVWTRQFGTASDDQGNGIALHRGNIIVGGMTYGTFPGQTSNGSSSPFIRKFDAQGKHLWTRQFGGTALATVNAVAASDKGIFVAGMVYGALPDGGGVLGDVDGFLARFTNKGAHVWTRQLGTTQPDSLSGVTVTEDGVYAAGDTAGVLPGQASAGGGDAFIVAYSHTGASLWSRQFGTSAYDTATGVAAGHGGLYVAGSTSGLLHYQHLGQGDAFVRRYSTAGAPEWTHQFGTKGHDTAAAITVFRGSIYVAGWLTDTLQGYSDAFVRRFDRTGGSVWVRQFGTESYDNAAGVAASNVGVFVTGRTEGTFVSASAGEGDVFLRRFVSYRPDGAIKRASSGGYAGNDIYNATGAGQTRSDPIEPGKRRTFVVRVQNDGDVPDRYLLKGCASGGQFTVVYREPDGTNISGQVADGTYQTGSLAAGAAMTVQLAMTASKNADAGREKTCATSITSKTRAVMTDVVKAKVTVSPPSG